MRPLVLVLAAFSVACHTGSPRPVTLDVGHDTCQSCRMVVSDARLAAQIVAPGEEPVFFDDFGCLSTFLKSRTSLRSSAAVYVADHRSGEWVLASRAVYTRVPSAATPMNGGIVAHADVASRDGDAAARGGTPVQARDIVGPFEEAH